jgi:hypothetical protein
MKQGLQRCKTNLGKIFFIYFFTHKITRQVIFSVSILMCYWSDIEI